MRHGDCDLGVAEECAEAEGDLQDCHCAERERPAAVGFVDVKSPEAPGPG